MIVQVFYNRIDKELLSVIKLIRNMKGEKEIVFSKGENNKVLINSYKVWEKGENKEEVVEQFYDIKIYEMVRSALLGVSS
mgnify:CR=1 FL=1